MNTKSFSPNIESVVRTLPRKIHPSRPKRFRKGGDLAPRGRGQSRGPRYNQCNAMHHIAMWWHFACLQLSTLYLSTSFSAQGCVPDICPRECIKNTVPSTLPREQGVYWILWSLKIMTYNRSSMLPVNTKKYIPTVQWILTVLKPILPWWWWENVSSHFCLLWGYRMHCNALLVCNWSLFVRFSFIPAHKTLPQSMYMDIKWFGLSRNMSGLTVLKKSG